MKCKAVLAALVLALGVPAQAATPPPTPTPARLPDGKPNWTGFWTLQGGLFDRNFGPGYVAPPPQAAQAPAPRPGAPPEPASLLKSPYKEQYAELRRKEAAGEPTYDASALCYPPGMPRMMNMTYGMEILQAQGVIAITSESGPATRRIWLDGRPHPPEDEIEPSFSGHSIGRWEGDVLVVETVGVRVEAVINSAGLMHSERMRLVERFSMPQPGVLIDEITVHDPEVFTAPWQLTRRYNYRPDLSLREYVCQENNRNVGEDGEPVFD